METIIFQETDPDILEVLYAALELEGYQVYAVQDCEPDFIEIIDKARPHVVMLDYRLSGEVCKAFCLAIKNTIRTCPYWPLAVIVTLMSATTGMALMATWKSPSTSTSCTVSCVPISQNRFNNAGSSHRLAIKAE